MKASGFALCLAMGASVTAGAQTEPVRIVPFDSVRTLSGSRELLVAQWIARAGQLGMITTDVPPPDAFAIRRAAIRDSAKSPLHAHVAAFGLASGRRMLFLFEPSGDASLTAYDWSARPLSPGGRAEEWFFDSRSFRFYIRTRPAPDK